MQRHIANALLLFCFYSSFYAMDLELEVKAIEDQQKSIDTMTRTDRSHMDKKEIKKQEMHLTNTIKQSIHKIDRLLSECMQLPDGVADEFTPMLHSTKKHLESLIKE